MKVTNLTVLSHYQAHPLLDARSEGETTARTSPDLNLTTVEVMLSNVGVTFPSGSWLSWDLVVEIAGDENKCYLIGEGTVREIRVFSETTNWVRTLYPTESAPTTLVSGMLMHRVRDSDPLRDTLEKTKAAQPVVGKVLDTATGLGYTAIEAAKTANRVVTVELDPAAIELARMNPWSQALFDNPIIEQHVGHAWDVVEEMEDGAFSVIIHDPPTISLGGDLYDGEFYGELFRVLKAGGRMFHYIGDPQSGSIRKLEKGIMERLRAAGFKKVVRKPRAFGVTAYK